jgi:hypothetical protein
MLINIILIQNCIELNLTELVVIAPEVSTPQTPKFLLKTIAYLLNRMVLFKHSNHFS